MGSQERCIYRVPSKLREVKPEAYRPRMLLIGPLNHSLKPKAYNDHADPSFLLQAVLRTIPDQTSIPATQNSTINDSTCITLIVDSVNLNRQHYDEQIYMHHGEDLRYLEYGMMEDQKLMYKDEFTKRPNGNTLIENMKCTIENEETNIRASYSESTAWIPKNKFVNLILHDSIFILEFILRIYESEKYTGDLIVNNPYYTSTVIDDLTLLENQLPYSCLEKLLNPIIEDFCEKQTLKQVILKLFSVNNGNITLEFKHFTDMFRCIYKESLGDSLVRGNSIVDMKNADKLSSVGVEFKVVKGDYSLDVSFNGGCLSMSSFIADESSDIILRNVIAYEQCHDPLNAFTTNYIHFMNFLVTTDQDVEILTSEGVLTNGMGRSSLVVEMVNKLCVGVLLSKESQYHGIVENLNIHYKSRRKICWAKLRRVYFSDLWTTTATITAVSLLLLTIGGTAASIIQAVKQ